MRKALLKEIFVLSRSFFFTVRTQALSLIFASLGQIICSHGKILVLKYHFF